MVPESCVLLYLILFQWLKVNTPFFSYLEYLKRSLDTTKKAFELYDVQPKNMQLTFQEISGVSHIMKYLLLHKSSITFFIERYPTVLVKDLAKYRSLDWLSI